MFNILVMSTRQHLGEMASASNDSYDKPITQKSADAEIYPCSILPNGVMYSHEFRITATRWR